LGIYTDPQKVQRTSRETEEMRFAVQPNGLSRAVRRSQ
jgi:hypothetical protein